MHYFEHVRIVIHRVADGESGEQFGERVCPVTKYSLLGGLPRTLEALVKSRGEAILSFVTRAPWLRIAGWAEPDNVS
jgi:hypothetical protein